MIPIFAIHRELFVERQLKEAVAEFVLNRPYQAFLTMALSELVGELTLPKCKLAYRLEFAFDSAVEALQTLGSNLYNLGCRK